jgi:hypothetical protein
MRARVKTLITLDITSVDWRPFGYDGQVLWLSLADGRRFGLVWGSVPAPEQWTPLPDVEL